MTEVLIGQPWQAELAQMDLIRLHDVICIEFGVLFVLLAFLGLGVVDEVRNIKRSNILLVKRNCRLMNLAQGSEAFFGREAFLLVKFPPFKVNLLF